MIVVDSREKKWETVFDRLSAMDAECKLEALNGPEHPKADYLVGDRTLGIQRKSVNDFVGSLDTLKNDLAELRQAHEMSALLLEGDWMVSDGKVAIERGESIEKTIPVTTLQDFVFSQQLRGTLFIRTAGLADTVETLAGLDEYVDEPVSPPIQRPNEPSMILQLIPGIGPTTAERIAAEYRTTYRALQHIGEWDQDVKGIGEETRDRAIQWFNQESINV